MRRRSVVVNLLWKKWPRQDTSVSSCEAVVEEVAKIGHVGQYGCEAVVEEVAKTYMTRQSVVVVKL